MIFSHKLLYFNLLFCISSSNLDAVGIFANDYKIKLASLQKCKLPATRIDKETSEVVTYYMSARKINRQTAVIRTNFTIGKKSGPMFISFRGYQVQQSTARDLVFKLERLTCLNPLTFQLVRSLKMKLDKQCYIMAGTYTADNINLQDFAWLFTKAMITPGKYSYDLEFATERGVVACITMIADIIYIK